MSRRTAVLVALAVLAPTVPALARSSSPVPERYDVTIRTTDYGIPHIQAKDYGSLGYGYGYAVADSAVCVLAESYTTVRAQRSMHFGAANGYTFRANGSTVNNLNSDVFYQDIIDTRRIEKLLATKGRHAIKPELLELARGYASGYNRWLAHVGGPKGITDPACRGKAWVTPISVIDVYRRFYQLALLASSGVAIDGIAAAQPPHPSAPVPTVDPTSTAAALAEEWKGLQIGSNAVAVGSEGTANGRGLLLGNPHFPWVGSERFFQAHLTIPGKLDVAGGSLLGVPLVLIGHTAHQAWSHTVSTSYRFTPYQETLVPGSPTTYLYDGVPTPMTSRTVKVRTGPTSTVSRTLWSTKHGPVFSSLLGLPLPWSPATAFSMADANAANFRYLNHFFDVNRAQSSRDVLTALKRNQGIPWVNTIAADDRGEALYADVSVTPHVTNDQVRTCATPIGQATFAALRLPVMNGALSQCEWGSDPDSAQKGTFGFSQMPWLIRSDYVTNSNDSYWLANPKAPLTGFATIIGDEGTERTTRTRSGLVMVDEVLAKGKFTRAAMERLLYSNRQHSWELTKADVLTMCSAFPGGYAPSRRGPVDATPACAALAKWDGRDGVASRGGLVFRRFWSNLLAAVPAPAQGARLRTAIWATPFDASDPVRTPRGLNIAHPLVLQAFGDAVNDLAGAKIPVTGRLGDHQKDVRPDGTVTPYHGGPGSLGVFNALNVGWDPVKGYARPLDHGSSFIQVVSFDGDGCPDARTILTYSQSPNPRSRHYADQTRLYGAGGWVTDRFCAQDVRRATRAVLRLRG